jgi:hypothetical protein
VPSTLLPRETEDPGVGHRHATAGQRIASGTRLLCTSPTDLSYKGKPPTPAPCARGVGRGVPVGGYQTRQCVTGRLQIACGALLSPSPQPHNRALYSRQPTPAYVAPRAHPLPPRSPCRHARHVATPATLATPATSPLAPLLPRRHTATPATPPLPPRRPRAHPLPPRSPLPPRRPSRHSRHVATPATSPPHDAPPTLAPTPCPAPRETPPGTIWPCHPPPLHAFIPVDGVTRLVGDGGALCCRAWVSPKGPGEYLGRFWEQQRAIWAI